MTERQPRERLYEVFADVDRDFGNKVDRALDIGTSHLNLPIGFLTRIQNGTQEIVYATGDHELLQPGESCPLDAAYCRRTIEIDGQLAVQDAAVSSSIDQRAVQTFDLGSYLGTKVTVDDELYGTVCFADREPRSTTFSESEELFLELLAELIGSALERRAYEQHLREQNERLQQEKQRFEGIAENSFDILFRIGMDGRFTYVSSAVERVLDYSPETLTGEYFHEFLADSASAAAARAYTQALDGRHVENLELDFLDRSGEVVVLEVNATPISADGEIVGVQGVGRNVTARKDRQRELRMKTQAIDAAAIGISMADMQQPDDPLVYANDGFERVTGYDAENVLGRNCRFLQGDRTDEATAARLRDAIDAGEPVTVELVNYRRDGIPFWNRIQLDPIYDDQGELAHYIGFQSDVTERKRTEQLIRLLNRVLRHNLRNDMTAVLGWSDMLRRDEGGDPTELGRRIERVSQELVDLSEHAREIERQARRDRQPRRLDPSALLDDLAADYRDRFPTATIGVDVRTDQFICAGSELERAVAELLENAVKHNPADEQTVHVSVTADDESIEVVVEDDGPGISEMEAEVVSSGRETALEHGSGLGLWLINWIVTRYGGSFQIRARGPDGDAGTTATVQLPAIGPDEPIEDAERGPTLLFF